MASLETLASLKKDVKDLIGDMKERPENYEYEDVNDTIHSEADRAVIYYADQYNLIKEAMEKNFEYDTDLVESMTDYADITQRLAIEAYAIAYQVCLGAFQEAGLI